MLETGVGAMPPQRGPRPDTGRTRQLPLPRPPAFRVKAIRGRRTWGGPGFMVDQQGSRPAATQVTAGGMPRRFDVPARPRVAGRSARPAASRRPPASSARRVRAPGPARTRRAASFLARASATTRPGQHLCPVFPDACGSASRRHPQGRSRSSSVVQRVFDGFLDFFDGLLHVCGRLTQTVTELGARAPISWHQG